MKAWYAYGLGANEVLNRMDVASSTRQTMVPDVQGSIIGTLDSATGALTKTGYWPFGENPSLAAGSFNYTAQRLDSETSGSASQPSGLYYYRARMYSPTLGRFLQADPAGYDTGINLYTYVGNDPLNATDPSGMCAEDACVVEGAAAYALVSTTIGTISGAVAGGFTAYKYTGKFWPTVGGIIAGGGAGAATGWASAGLGPIIASFGAGLGLSSGVSAAGGVAITGMTAGGFGAASTDFAVSLSGARPDWGRDIGLGTLIGGAVTLPEATATGLLETAGLRWSLSQSIAIQANTALLGTVGSIGTTCTLSGGCGPGTAGMATPITANASQGFSGLSSNPSGSSTDRITPSK